MVTVIYEEFDGAVHRAVGEVGESVMNLAVRNGVPGIVGECGGALSCASCHVYVDDAWLDRTGLATEAEDDAEDEMLEATVSERLESSRLSCQLRLSDGLDGLRVRLPPEQL